MITMSGKCLDIKDGMSKFFQEAIDLNKMTNKNDSDVVKELTDLLKECEIDKYVLNTADKKLEIKYKEDFDIFYPRLNAEPKMNDPNVYGAPYGFGLIAFFDYKGWEIKGWITHHKPKIKKSNTL